MKEILYYLDKSETDYGLIFEPNEKPEPDHDFFGNTLEDCKFTKEEIQRLLDSW